MEYILSLDAGTTLTALNVDGGAAANDLLMQFQADILGKTVNRAPMLETTALGAAFLAGLATGVWTQDCLRALRETSGTAFVPRMSDAEAQRLYAGWRKAVDHARHWLACAAAEILV